MPLVSKPKNRRWVCDRCGSTMLAPGRARLIDVRRWCLPCSEETGELVPRYCPALERERERKRQARARKRKRSRDRAKEATLTFGTVGRVHVPTEFDRMLDVPSAARALGFGRPSLAMIQRSSAPRMVGRASWSSRTITVYTWPGLADYEVLATLAHEIAHLAVPATSAHNDEWRAAFLEIVRDRFPGIEIPTPKRRSYHDLDYAVEGAISRWLTATLDDGLEGPS